MPGLTLGAWLIELRDDPDKDFLLAGISDGFDIVNIEVLVVPVEVILLCLLRACTHAHTHTRTHAHTHTHARTHARTNERTNEHTNE